MAAFAEITSRARGGVDAESLARLARRTPEPVLRAALMRPTRALVIAQIFRQMPAQLKDSASIQDATIRWDVTHPGAEPDTWYLVFAKGGCRTTRSIAAAAKPRTTLSVDAMDLLQLASGAANPMQMFQQGRIKISGDLFFAAQLQSMFRIPTGPPTTSARS